MMQLARVLVVDDFMPWRDRIRSILKARPGWKIVSEASDGTEAVQKATDLMPDIIILDVGLPKLNGIEASKVIRQRCPQSKIVFVTQDGDRSVRDAALGIGDGYVRKVDAARELVNAIASTLNNGGRR